MISQRPARRVLLVAVLSAAGCGRAAPPSRFPSAAAALERMHATYECSRGVSGEAKTESYGEEGRRVVNVLFWSVLPERLRFEVLPPNELTFPLIIVTSNGKHFAQLDKNNRRFVHGPSSTCNLARFTRVAVPPFALVQLLRGEAPVLVHEPRNASIAWESGRYVIRIRSKHQASEEIHLEPNPADWNLPFGRQRLRVLEVRVEQQGYELYRAELDGHAPAPTADVWTDPDRLSADVPPSGPPCKAEVPHRVRLLVAEEERDVLLRYEEVAHNPPLLSDLFDQTPPQGVSVRYADCRE
jgi:outer membrane lipoprotein-sorting protein